MTPVAYITPYAQIRTYGVEYVFQLQKSRNNELMYDNLVEILKHSALEQAEEPQPEHKERPVSLSKSMGGLGLIEARIWCLSTLIRTKNEQQQQDKDL